MSCTLAVNELVGCTRLDALERWVKAIFSISPFDIWGEAKEN